MVVQKGFLVALKLLLVVVVVMVIANLWICQPKRIYGFVSRETFPGMCANGSARENFVNAALRGLQYAHRGAAAAFFRQSTTLAVVEQAWFLNVATLTLMALNLSDFFVPPAPFAERARETAHRREPT